jgi:hypothetical protein
MNIVENRFLDGCILVEEYNHPFEGEIDEETQEKPSELTKVLWDMFPSFNLAEGEEVIEEGLPVQSDYDTKSKGPISQQQPTTSQAPNTRKTWIVTATIKISSNTPNTNKPSTNYSNSMEYNIVPKKY